MNERVNANEKYKHNENKTNNMHAMFSVLRTGKYVKHAKESVVSHLMPYLIRIQRALIDISSLHIHTATTERRNPRHEKREQTISGGKRP